MSEERIDGAGPDDRLAGEYALGVLDAAARAAAEGRIGRDPAFAALVAAWDERLSPLVEEIPPVEAPAGTWQRIEGRLFGAAPEGGLLASLAFWRWAAGAAAALAVASLVALGVVLTLPAAPPLMAALRASDSGPVYLVRLAADGRRLTIRPSSAAAGDDTVPQLWLIPADGTPRSLGVIAEAGPSEVTIPAALAADVRPDATLAVSREPVGGSPTGQPTGPVVAVGSLEEG